MEGAQLSLRVTQLLYTYRCLQLSCGAIMDWNTETKNISAYTSATRKPETSCNCVGFCRYVVHRCWNTNCKLRIILHCIALPECIRVNQCTSSTGSKSRSCRTCRRNEFQQSTLAQFGTVWHSLACGTWVAHIVLLASPRLSKLVQVSFVGVRWRVG